MALASASLPISSYVSAHFCLLLSRHPPLFVGCCRFGKNAFRFVGLLCITACILQALVFLVLQSRVCAGGCGMAWAAIAPLLPVSSGSLLEYSPVVRARTSAMPNRPRRKKRRKRKKHKMQRLELLRMKRRHKVWITANLIVCNFFITYYTFTQDGESCWRQFSQVPPALLSDGDPSGQIVFDQVTSDRSAPDRLAWSRPCALECTAKRPRRNSMTMLVSPVSFPSTTTLVTSSSSWPRIRRLPIGYDESHRNKINRYSF